MMNGDISIKFMWLRPDQDKDIPEPCYMTRYSSGMDICAAVENEVVLLPRDIKLVSTGFALEIPRGFEAQIRPRSGLAIRDGVTLLNSPGTIDSDYRGEVKIIIVNFGSTPFILERGDRIAQMVISRVYRADFDFTECLDVTRRGSGGFGHTGLRK